MPRFSGMPKTRISSVNNAWQSLTNPREIIITFWNYNSICRHISGHNCIGSGLGVGRFDSEKVDISSRLHV